MTGLTECIAKLANSEYIERITTLLLAVNIGLHRDPTS